MTNALMTTTAGERSTDIDNRSGCHYGLELKEMEGLSALLSLETEPTYD